MPPQERAALRDPAAEHGAPAGSALRSRPQSRGEVIADAVLHGLGLTGALSGGVVLMTLAGARGGLFGLAVMLVYTLGLTGMLACSAIYNLAGAGPRRELLRRLDQSAIFLMIAASYTPFTMLWLEGTWSVLLSIAVWSIAAAGALAKLLRAQRFEPLTIPLYLALGWLGLLAIGPLQGALGPVPITLLLAGGGLYTFGVIFHLWRRLPFHNALWHGCVIAAAGFHYSAIVTGMLTRPPFLG